MHLPLTLLPTHDLLVSVGILGEAAAVAEATQSHAAPDTISCSSAARDAYLASAYAFQPIAIARSPGLREYESFAVTFAAAPQLPTRTSSLRGGTSSM